MLWKRKKRLHRLVNKSKEGMKMEKLVKSQSPARIIAFGFALAIALGSILLMLPCSVKAGVELDYIDALYTSTSAVCVTGLIAVDAGDTFTTFGQIILGLLIQIGGLGVTAVGAGIILVMGKRFDFKERTLVKEAMNLNTGKGVVLFVKNIFFTTLLFEFIGAFLSFFVFMREYPLPKAIGISMFHSVAAFNNSGFDILGQFQNLMPYKNNILLNLVTCGLIFFGGRGFWTILELKEHKLCWKKYSMHTKVVLSVSFILIVVGMVMIRVTQNITWLGAFFFSVSARTAGFSTFSLSEFSTAGLLVLIFLMFVGASPGSTGGGIKTSTFVVLLQGIKGAATNQSEKIFHYAVPKDAFKKAAVIALLAIAIVFSGTVILTILEPHIPLEDLLFEVTSAFGTVGLSTGITPKLKMGSKLLCIIIMYIGRLGPLTIASLWYFSRGERVSFPRGNIAIG